MKIYELIESVRKPSLEQFLNGTLKNQYVFFRSSDNIEITSYVRKGPRNINGIIFDKVLDRANTSLVASKYKNKMIKSGNVMANTGAYREFDIYMTNMAKKYNYDGIYVESVINDNLHNVLKRYGYELLPNSYPASYWKKL